MALFSGFAALGLALAAIGIYSVISYNVTQRVQEIGVRMALGAKRGDILKLVLLMVARVAALGLAIGLCGSIVARANRALPGVCENFIRCGFRGDGGCLLAGVALLAAWLPAARAGNLDPVTALRHDA